MSYNLVQIKSSTLQIVGVFIQFDSVHIFKIVGIFLQFVSILIWAASWGNLIFAICEQQRHRSAYASAQWICYAVAFQQKTHYYHGRHQMWRASNQMLWNVWPYDCYDIMSWHWKAKTFNEDMYYIFNKFVPKQILSTSKFFFNS